MADRRLSDMDSSQEAANRATVENTILSRKLVNIGYATLVVCAIGTLFAVWAVLRSPDASQAPSTGGGFMWLKWLPVIILGSCSLTLAVALFVVSFRRLKYGKHESDYKLARTQLNSVKEELATANSTNLQLGKDLESQTKLLESKTQSLEISRREVAEVRAEADAQTRTYDLTFSGMKEEMAGLKRDLENATKTINFEVNQRDQWMKQCDEAKSKLAELWWLRERAVAHGDYIEEYVIIRSIKPHRLNLDKKPHMSVILEIENGSLFDVTILTKDIEGYFHFDNEPFETNVRASKSEERILIGSYKPSNNPPTLLVIEQPLRGFEADRIRKADGEAHFWLGNLGIWVCVDDKVQSNPGVRRKKLIIPPDFADVHLKAFREKFINGNTDIA